MRVLRRSYRWKCLQAGQTPWTGRRSSPCSVTPEVVKMVRATSNRPVGPHGRRPPLSPVSTFLDHADGQPGWRQGAAATKRGVADDMPPAWDAAFTSRVQPVRVRVPAAPPPPVRPHRGKPPPLPPHRHGAGREQTAGLQYTLAVSPLDCMGCGVCVNDVPLHDSLTMVPGKPAGATGRVRLLR